MKFIVEGVTNSAPADTTLIRLLVRGQKIAKRMFESNCPPLEAIAHEERITAFYATRRRGRAGIQRRRQHVRRRYAGRCRPAGSKATSQTKGSRRNLGDLVWPAVAVTIPGRGLTRSIDFSLPKPEEAMAVPVGPRHRLGDLG